MLHDILLFGAIGRYGVTAVMEGSYKISTEVSLRNISAGNHC